MYAVNSQLLDHWYLKYTHGCLQDDEKLGLQLWLGSIYEVRVSKKRRNAGYLVGSRLLCGISNLLYLIRGEVDSEGLYILSEAL